MYHKTAGSACIFFCIFHSYSVQNTHNAKASIPLDLNDLFLSLLKILCHHHSV